MSELEPEAQPPPQRCWYAECVRDGEDWELEPIPGVRHQAFLVLCDEHQDLIAETVGIVEGAELRIDYTLASPTPVVWISGLTSIGEPDPEGQPG